MAHRVSVLWSGVRSEPLKWESRVQDIGPPETSWPHIISISKRSPRDHCHNTKTQLHSTTRSSSAGLPMLNNYQDRNTTPPISREAAYNHTKLTDTPKHTTGCGIAHQKERIQPHPPEHRHHSPPPGSLHNPLNQPNPP